jgi:hypothetical protein
VDKQVRNRYVPSRIRRCAMKVRRKTFTTERAESDRGGREAAFALVDDNGLGEAILRAHAVLAPEELQKAEATFEDSGAVAEGALDGLPESETTVLERDGAGPSDPLARRAAVAQEVGKTEVEEQEDEISGLVKIPDEVDVLLVKELDAVENFAWRPENDGDEEIDDVAEQALPEGGEGKAFELVHAGGFVGVKAALPLHCLFLGRGGHGCG